MTLVWRIAEAWMRRDAMPLVTATYSTGLVRRNARSLERGSEWGEFVILNMFLIICAFHAYVWKQKKRTDEYG